VIRALRTRRFAALVSPAQVCLLEYSLERAGVSLAGQWSESGPFARIEDAADRLAVMISAQGAGRATVEIAVDHFGAFHHVMSLPPAPVDVLRPIVEREVQRTFGLNRVAVDFAVASDTEEDTRLPQARTRRVNAIGAPTEVVTHLRDRLAAGKVRVERITVMGQAVSDAYRSTAGETSRTTAVVVCTAAGPYVCFFLDGELVLTIDVPPLSDEAHDDDLTVVHQVEQGAVYFRQQFRGARAERLLLACESQRLSALSAALHAAIGVPVEPLGAEIGDGASVVAFGAAVGAREADSMELLGQLTGAARKQARASSGGMAAVMGVWFVALVSAGWAASSIYALNSQREQIAKFQKQYAAVEPALGPKLAAAKLRQSHDAGGKIVADIRAERVLIGRTLTGIERARPAGVLLDSLVMFYGPDGFEVAVVGRAEGVGTVALGRILGLRTNVGAQISVENLNVDNPPDSSVFVLGATKFSLTFRVPGALR
jgi:hypothetical protein